MNLPDASTSRKPPSIWDNDLPVGDSPPLPRWPLTFFAALYVAWMIFLISMVIVRFRGG